jgi:mono/diheme cytochrome c family protein
MTMRSALGIVSVVLLAGCSEPGTDTAAAPEPQVQAPAASDQAPRTEFRIPPETFEPDAATGSSLFAAHCAVCHGPEALGTEQGPPLIHRIYEPSHHSNLAFYRAIALGVHQHHWEFGDMPPVPGVSGEDAAYIISWIRQQQQLAGIQ